MNRVLVAQAAAGFAAYLRERAGDPAKPATVVIGYDGRRNSARVRRGLGRDVRRRRAARDPAPPAAADARAGLRGAAPRRGCRRDGDRQPQPAATTTATRCISAATTRGRRSSPPRMPRSPRTSSGSPTRRSGLALPRSLGVRDARRRRRRRVRRGDRRRRARSRRSPRTCAGCTRRCTASGWETLSRIADRRGLSRADRRGMSSSRPTRTFRTVSFPNPEEPGAMDLAFAAARRGGRRLHPGERPDADRLAVAIPDARRRRVAPTDRQRGRAAARWRRGRGRPAPREHPQGASLACSLVSSPGLAAVAAHHGLDFHETLTGFKWISRAPGMVFGFEEALGYLVESRDACATRTASPPRSRSSASRPRRARRGATLAGTARRARRPTATSPAARCRCASRTSRSSGTIMARAARAASGARSAARASRASRTCCRAPGHAFRRRAALLARRRLAR